MGRKLPAKLMSRHAEDLITFGDPLAELSDQLAVGELARGLVGGVTGLTDDHAEIQVDPAHWGPRNWKKLAGLLLPKFISQPAPRRWLELLPARRAWCAARNA